MFDINEMYSLKGRVAVVTGGATGLGLAVTRCFISAGAKVIVLSRNEDRSHKALAECGDRAVFYKFDITDTARAQQIVDRIIGEHGNVSILVQNAGTHCKKPIEEMTVEDYDGVLQVHLVGSYALTKAFIPHMKKNANGSIIFMASMTSFIGQPNVCGYASAKAGILGLVHVLTAECAADGVRVNAIAPGWIDTPMFHKAVDNDPPRLAKIMGRIPMKKVGDPMDIGMCAAFLASDASRYISGICLPVDGGALIGF